MGDQLSVSTSELARSGSQVAASSDPILSASAALAGLQGVVKVPEVGTGIAAAASGFCGELAARVTALAGLTRAQGEAITEAARLYTVIQTALDAAYDRQATAAA